MKVLAGDIGGTKTLLRVLETDGARFHTLAELRYPSADYPQFMPLVDDFLSSTGVDGQTLAAACFGIAGPVNGRRARTTNLPWEIDADALAAHLKLGQVSLLNDFEAVGYGIDVLEHADLLTLQSGQPRTHAARAVLGAGTGLGVALLVYEDDHYRVLPSEAGHTGFTPTDSLQLELLRWLMQREDPPCLEHVLSGQGLINLFDFLCNYQHAAPGEALERALAQGDPAAAISTAALGGSDPLAVQALDLFCTIYGSVAGNLALIALAHGGIYIAGGIAPKIVTCLRNGGFLRAFNHKGKMRTLVQQIPVHIVLNEQVGLLGAAAVAARLARNETH